MSLNKIVVDCSKGTQTVVPLTAQEIAERDQLAAQHEENKLKAEEEARTLAAAKASAEVKLAALGLTAEEIAAL